MDLAQKVRKALTDAFSDAYIRLEADDGISGFVVSSKFDDMPSLDRQTLIDEALTQPPNQLSRDEQRQVLMIAGITPLEFDSVGPRIRVHMVRKQGGSVKVVLRGGQADAEYVLGALKGLKGVKTNVPKKGPGEPGFMHFLAKGSEAEPLTETKVLKALKGDPYIEVVPSA